MRFTISNEIIFAHFRAHTQTHTYIHSFACSFNVSLPSSNSVLLHIHHNSNDSDSGNGAISHGPAESGPFPHHFLCLVLGHTPTQQKCKSAYTRLTLLPKFYRKQQQEQQYQQQKSSARAFISVGLIVIYRVNQSNL